MAHPFAHTKMHVRCAHPVSAARTPSSKTADGPLPPGSSLAWLWLAVVYSRALGRRHFASHNTAARPEGPSEDVGNSSKLRESVGRGLETMKCASNPAREKIASAGCSIAGNGLSFGCANVAPDSGRQSLTRVSSASVVSASRTPSARSSNGYRFRARSDDEQGVCLLLSFEQKSRRII